MNNLTRNNLQLVCRICLSALQQGAETAFDIHLVPDLTKLFIIFTTLDVNEDNDMYPKSLCKLCFHKLQDFQSFRSMALQSAEVLRKIINDQEIADKKVAIDGNYKYSFAKRHQRANQYNEGDDNNQLLLPELSSANFCEKSIKTESIDIADNTHQIDRNFYKHPGEIKEEKDSENEDCALYENYAQGNQYLSSEDYDNNDAKADVSDEEKEKTESTLSNSSIITISTSVNKRVRKRDRRKKALKCPLCDKQVYKQVYLDAHIRAVHEGHEKPFLCVQCHKSFTRYNQLHVHMQSTHLKAEKFECEYEGCDAMFKMLTTLETHRKVVHTTNPPPPLSLCLQQELELHQAQLSKEDEMDHFCQQCLKKFSSKRTLSEHLKRHANIKEHVCRVCGVAKVTRTELLTHMRIHQPDAEKFKCHICPQEFNHKNAIQRHVRIVHEGLRPFACNYCPKKFSTRNSMMCHERLHTGERPFVCEICEKSFAQSEGLKSHMKNHDKSLRTHVCRFCSQRFITRKNLIDHEGRHSGDKPHICEFCSRGFFNREDMLRHRVSHVESLEIEEIRDGKGDSYTVDMAGNGSSQDSN